MLKHNCIEIIRESFISVLRSEKKDLIEKLPDYLVGEEGCFIAKDPKKKSVETGTGAKVIFTYDWPLKLNDQDITVEDCEIDLRINCTAEGEPKGRGSGGTGTGRNQIKLNIWIPIICRLKGQQGNKSIEIDRNYNIALNQQDIDINTGNFHTVFGIVQLWHGLEEYEGCENGGEINDPGKLNKRKDGTISLVYNPQKGFPPAIRNNTEQKNDYKYGGNVIHPETNNIPWGIDYTKKQSEDKTLPKIPKTFDMGSDKYDTDEIAAFAAALIKLDLERELENELKKGE